MKRIILSVILVCCGCGDSIRRPGVSDAEALVRTKLNATVDSIEMDENEVVAVSFRVIASSPSAGGRKSKLLVYFIKSGDEWKGDIKSLD